MAQPLPTPALPLTRVPRSPVFTPGHAHIRLALLLPRAFCPFPPACGGRGRGLARQHREGEGGGGAVRNPAFPHLTPTLSALEGGEKALPGGRGEERGRGQCAALGACVV